MLSKTNKLGKAKREFLTNEVRIRRFIHLPFFKNLLRKNIPTNAVWLDSFFENVKENEEIMW